MKNNIISILKTTLILVLIVGVTTTLVAFANLITKNKIEELDKKSTQENIEEILQADNYEDVSQSVSGCKFAYDAYDDDQYIGSIYLLEENGYGGAVSVMVAIDNQGLIKRVKVIDASNETPGLGQNSLKDSFTEQFTGKENNVSIDDISAITGATITSKAVTKAVDNALKLNSSREVK